MTKILRVKMTKLEMCEENAAEKYSLLGGRGLTSKIISEEVDPKCQPLGKYNKIVIAPGLLTGTSAPCSGRLSFGGKSPLTGTIKEANAGGTASQKIAKLGYKAIIIEGMPEQSNLYVLKINFGGAQIVEANELRGLGTYDTVKALRDKYGNNYSVICIGPAGENKLLAASIAVTNMEGQPSRHAGRGGLGAVLGSKGIKAIIAVDDGQDQIAYANEKEFKEQAKSLAKSLVETKQVMTMYGTSCLVNIVNSLKGLPTYNFRRGDFEGAEKISGESLKRKIEERNGKTGHPCHPGCVIRCSNVYNDEKGEYITSGLEYETIALTGSNCGIDDLDVIAKIDRFCDDFGIDTMDTGVSIGILMEFGMLNFGDTNGVFKLLNEIKLLTPLGRVLGCGADITGKVFGISRVPTVKGQAISAYDPRTLKGTGITYATSPMGADHTAGVCLPGKVGYREETKDSSKINYAGGDKKQVALSSDLQVMISVCDSLGICIMVGVSPNMMEVFAALMNKRFGLSVNGKDLIKLGQDMLLTEISFNRAASTNNSTKDDLPEFFREEKLEPNGNVFDVLVSDMGEVFNFSPENSY